MRLFFWNLDIVLKILHKKHSSRNNIHNVTAATKKTPSQHLEEEGKLVAKLCPALLPKQLRLRDDKVAQQLPGVCQTSWSWTKVLSKLVKKTNTIIDCSNFILQRYITIGVSSHPKFGIWSCLHSGKWRTGLWGKPVEFGIEEGSIQVGPIYISSII